jgi:hypothetical protein
MREFKGQGPVECARVRPPSAFRRRSICCGQRMRGAIGVPLSHFPDPGEFYARRRQLRPHLFRIRPEKAEGHTAVAGELARGRNQLHLQSGVPGDLLRAQGRLRCVEEDDAELAHDAEISATAATARATSAGEVLSPPAKRTVP